MEEKEREETIGRWRSELMAKAEEEKAAVLRRYFKTGEGEYGEGDVFIGVAVPEIRKITRRYWDNDTTTISEMMNSEVHEFRVSAVVALTRRYEKSKDDGERQAIARLYVDSAELVNNWDLVDISAPHILGGEIMAGRGAWVESLAEEPLLWRRRMAMVGHQTAIKNGIFDGAERVANRLMDDSHDLIRKAIGWMLREIGDHDMARLEKILRENITRISAVTLSYATEKMPFETRRTWRDKRRASQSQRIGKERHKNG